MTIDMPLAELLILAGAVVASGLVMGFLSGFFGIGGGGVAVPILYELFRLAEVPEDVRMQLAVGTSLAIMIPTTWRSAAAHRAKGSLDSQILRRLAVPLLVGVAAGVVVAGSAPSDLMRIVWVLFATAMCLKLVFGKESWRLGDDVPRGLGFEAYGVFVGFVSTLLSIGGGAFVTMMLTLYGRPITQAIGTSAGVGPLIAIPAALGFVWAGWGASGLPPLSLGYVSLIGAALVIPASVLAAPIGVRAAHGIRRRTLELCFAGFLGLVGLRFFVALVG
jgi:uncharacterized membrane protein YfcA